MRIQTTRFGPIEVNLDDIIHFPEGVLGFPTCHDWVLLADVENDAVAWMQSTDRPDVALAVTAPRRFIPDYQIRVARRELDPLLLEQVCQAEVLTIISPAEQTLSLNLKAPLVINLDQRLGRQIVTNGDLPIRYELGTQTAWKKSA